jgi:hypothetical protein
MELTTIINRNGRKKSERVPVLNFMGKRGKYLAAHRSFETADVAPFLHNFVL